MKTRSEVTADKLRGGFYTPAPLVRHAMQRLQQLLPEVTRLRILEPGAGDGAFLEGIGSASLDISEVLAIEIDAKAAKAARSRLRSQQLPGKVVNASTLAWSLNNKQPFDVVVGNLPFVRFQFVDAEDRENAIRHGNELGVNVAGIANLWLPMMLSSLRHLAVGGAFVLVLPAECFTGVSAGNARQWLLANMDDLRCDLYPVGSFPGVLQEVVLLSGRRGNDTAAARTLRVVQHRDHCSSTNFDEGIAEVQEHVLKVGQRSWTDLLLKRSQLEAYEEASSLKCVKQLGLLARFEVAAVTGANTFFSLSRDEIDRYGLRPWARPLLARARHAPGLRFAQADYQSAVDAGLSAFMFDASLAPVDLKKQPGLRSYLALGESLGIPERYKCRIREPWYAIPYIKHGDLLLSKRCHRYPRLILNETDAVTTDTIYRGTVTDPVVSPIDIVAGFHNSLTLLSAELLGRNFGGGVLELVPSEVARLQVPVIQNIGEDMIRLDTLYREIGGSSQLSDGQEILVHETNLLLAKASVGLTLDLLETLSDARTVLQRRRLERASRLNIREGS